MWKSSATTLEVVASFSGVPDLRTYLMLHQHLGEPAIRKVARQVIKGASLHVTACQPAMLAAGVRSKEWSSIYQAAPTNSCYYVRSEVSPVMLHAAMIVMTRHTHCPVHKLSIQDVHIKAGNGRIIVLPSFIWREFQPLNGAPTKNTLDVSDPRTCASRQTTTASSRLFRV